MPTRSVSAFIPQRWIVCVLCSLAFAIIDVRNTCFYRLVEIVDAISYADTISSSGCPFLFSGTYWEIEDLPPDLPRFYWDPMIYNRADYVYYVGYILIVVPAGILSDLGYSRGVFVGGMLLAAINDILITILIGIILNYTHETFGVIVHMIEHFIEGVSNALIYPSVITLISRWAEPTERNFYTSVIVAGQFYGHSLGHVVLFQLAYLEFKSHRLGHFVMGIIWLILITLAMVYIRHSPLDNSSIQQHENTSSIVYRRSSNLTRLKRLFKIPWCKIFSSFPFLSLVLAFCSVDWLAYMNIWGTFEYYQKHILLLPHKFTDMSSAIVIVVVPATLIGGLFADWIIKNNIMSKTVVKRTFTCVSVLLSSILQVTATYVGCNIILFWVIINTAAYVYGPASPVIYSAPVDFNLQHCGLLMGIMNGTRGILAIFKEKFHEILITDDTNVNQWRYKVLFYSILSLAMLIPFIFFGSVEAEHWSRPHHPVNPSNEVSPRTNIETETLPHSVTPPTKLS